MADKDQAEEGLYSYDSFGEPRKKKEGNFLWWCSGAHSSLLKDFPSEQTKYAGLGGVILATFVLAALSAGYAIHTVFDSWLWTISFALIWGLIIFNFDRFLVSTMRKYGVSRRKQMWMAAPRLLLAILIGITLARPLEMKIFEKEINVKMQENLHKKIQLNDSLLAIEAQNQLATATSERERLTTRKQNIEDTLRMLQNAYVQEADGTGGSMQRGIRDLTALKQNAYLEARTTFQPELLAINQSIGSQDSILASTRSSMEEKRIAYEQVATANMGFLERNKALSDLTAEESSVFWTVLLVSLLIIMIEVGPVLSKLIMPVGPYDIALAREELLRMAKDENEIRKDKELEFQKKKVFYQKQKEMSQALVQKLTELQQKNIDKELEKWERGEWTPQDHRASMDEVLRKIREQYNVKEDDIL